MIIQIKKHSNTLTDEQLHTHMIRYMDGKIDEHELNNITQHYIGN
jgi:hypothetical protein